MSADFWAGYVSGAAGIIIGNPLDIVKVNLQRGTALSSATPQPSTSPTPSIHNQTPPPPPTPNQNAAATSNAAKNLGVLLRGTAFPILGYGALNALMFYTYNRTMSLLSQDPASPSSLPKTFVAGALGGLATFIVSAPTELVKCRAQVTHASKGSWAIARDIWRQGGVRGFYWGGAVTSARDSVGYGFYFWSYELSKRVLMSSERDAEKPEWMTILLCGGIAGVVTWASVFPLDVIKTRVQTQGISQSATVLGERSHLLPTRESGRLGTMQIAKQAYREEGLSVFFRGLGVCSFRAFFVNAVQWAVYEWMMHILLRQDSNKHD